MDQFYTYNFQPFCEKHYIKEFSKKYKNFWVRTRNDIINSIKRIDMFTKLKRADVISIDSCYQLVKLDFAIDGLRQSAKSSGNRCILHVDNESRHVEILLIYSKNNICEPNETSKWKSKVKQEFPEIASIYRL
jgi:hypothetical protein